MEDWQRAAELVAEAAAAETTTDLVDRVLRHLHRLFAAELVIWDRFDDQARQQAYRMFPSQGETIARLQPAFVAYWHQHPFCRDFVEVIGGGRIAILSDRISTRDFLRTDLWREVYIHLRAKHQIAIGGPIGAGYYWTFGCNRLRGDYGPRERELGRFLQPHLTACFQRLARRERAERSGALLADCLNEARASYLLVDATGLVLEASPWAEEKLAGTLTIVPGSTRLAELAVRERALMPAATLTYHRIGPVAAIVLRPSGAGAGLVLLGESDQAAANKSKLTRREAEILRWIAEGKSDQEIAKLLGLSQRTVEKHCERLFQKLGVENRTSAALLPRSGA